MVKLHDMINAAYQAQVLGIGSYGAAVDQLRAAMAENPSLRDQAMIELSRCIGVDPQRCFASLKTRQFLEDVMRMIQQ